MQQRWSRVCSWGDTVGRDAVFEAWHALSGAIRSWACSHAKIYRSGSTDGVCSAEVGRTLQRESIAAHFDHSSSH